MPMLLSKQPLLQRVTDSSACIALSRALPVCEEGRVQGAGYAKLSKSISTEYDVY